MAEAFGFEAEDDFGFEPAQQPAAAPAAVADFGFEPAAADDFGFTPERDLEAERIATEQAKRAEQEAAAVAAAQAAAAENDPTNWSADKTKREFRKNPPTSPDEMVQREVLLAEKKSQEAQAVEQAKREAVLMKIKGGAPLLQEEKDLYFSDKWHSEITPAPPMHLWDRAKKFAGAFIKSPPQALLPEKALAKAGILGSPEQQRARAWATKALSQVTGKSTDEIEKDFERYAMDPRVTGMLSEPTRMEIVHAAMTPLVAAGVVGDVVTMVAGKPPVVIPTLAAFGVLDAVFPAEKWINSQRELSPEFKDTLKLVDFAVKGKFAHGLGSKGGVMLDAQIRPIMEKRLGLAPGELKVQGEALLQKLGIVQPAAGTPAAENIAASTQPAEQPPVPGELVTFRGGVASLQKIDAGQAELIRPGGVKELVPASEVARLTVNPTQLPEILEARKIAREIPHTEAINTPERLALRQNLTEEFYGTGAGNKARRADLVLGGPASGKSQVVDPLLAEHKSLLIDSDLVKERLPEYRNGYGAEAVHRESSNIIEAAIFERAIKAGDNIVLPRLGKNPETVRGLIQALRDNDYEVNLHLVELPLDKAMQRTVNRFIERGRFVDPAYVEAVGLKPGQTYDMLRGVEGVNSYARYSTDVPKGQRPRIVEDSRRGDPLPGNSSDIQRERGLQRPESTGDRATSSGGAQAQPVTTEQVRLSPEGPLKERKFIQTVREAPKTAPEVAKAVESSYKPITNEATLAEAKRLIERSSEEAQILVEGPERPTAVSNATAILLIDKAQQEGRFQDAIRLVERTAQKNTDMGQAIQALSIYQRLSPEGILQHAAKVVREARTKIPQAEGRVKGFEKAVKGLTDEAEIAKQAKRFGVPHLPPEKAAQIRAMAEEIQKLPEGRERTIKTALMMQEISRLVPRSLWQKVSMLQTMAQLLNPKTFIRNILGNGVFFTMENVAEGLATAIDVATALRTGQRTVMRPLVGEQLKGLVQGAKEGTEEALLGINTRDMGTRFDLPRNGVFDKGVLGALEKTMSLALQAPDRAFYQAAFNQSLRQQQLLAKVAEPTGEMIEKAHLAGLYRTFQDKNVISNMFVGLKRVLNAGGQWGLGDMVIKYPKTPANLLARGIEYSPFGFVKTVFDAFEPLTGRPFRQESFVRSTARAITGTSLLVGTGYILGKLGIISGKRPEQKDRDVRATQQEAGLRSYQVNVDALQRFMASGMSPDQAEMREGDALVSYDWMQPSSIGLALGADLALSPKQSSIDKVMAMADRVALASETLTEQPLMRGVQTLTSRGSIQEGLADTFQGIPASFMPTLLNQIKQLTDNTVRNTRDPKYFQEVYKKAQGRMPGAAEDLPPLLGSLGQERETFQGGTNNAYNVLLNPAFVSEFRPNPVSQMVLEIYETSGETVHFPRMVEGKIKLGAEELQLTPEQFTDYQRYVGEKTDVLFSILAQNEGFRALPADVQAKKLQGFLTDINTAAKIELFDYRPSKVSGDVIDLIRLIGNNVQQIKANEDFDFQPE